MQLLTFYRICLVFWRCNSSVKNWKKMVYSKKTLLQQFRYEIWRKIVYIDEACQCDSVGLWSFLSSNTHTHDFTRSSLRVPLSLSLSLSLSLPLRQSWFYMRVRESHDCGCNRCIVYQRGLARSVAYCSWHSFWPSPIANGAKSWTSARFSSIYPFFLNYCASVSCHSLLFFGLFFFFILFCKWQVTTPTSET